MWITFKFRRLEVDRMSPLAAPPKTLFGALRLFRVAPAKIGGQGIAVPFSRLRPSSADIAG